MILLTETIKQKLLDNGNKQLQLRGTEECIDFVPVVKLFMPLSAATWLLTEIDPEDNDIAFGLCDLGLGFPELGSVSLSELESVKIYGVGVERDLSFKADKPISEYSTLARQNGRIVENTEARSR